MDLHLNQKRVHIISGDLIVRICSAGILLEEIPSGKPVPNPPPTVPPTPPATLFTMEWNATDPCCVSSKLIPLTSSSEADHRPAVQRDVT